MQEAIAQSLRDVRDGEVGRRVVAEVLGIAEGEARDVVVIGEPGYERERREAKARDPVKVLAAQ